MDLGFYLRVLRRRWRVFVLVVVVCIGGAAAGAYVQTPTYEATAVLVVTTPAAAPGSPGQSPTADGASTLAQFAMTPPVEDTAVQQATRATGLVAHQPLRVVAAADANTPFLRITVDDHDARWAQAVANAYVTAMPAALRGIDPAVAASAEQVTVLTAAPVPASPANPNKRLYLLMGLLLGVVFAAGVVMLSEALDRRLYGTDGLPAHLGAPVLGVVHEAGSGGDLAVRTDPTSDRAEAYRSVLAALTFGRPDGVPRSVTITGLAPAGGVTSLVANLGLALVGGGRSVVLIDANLRRPELHQVFALSRGPGLVDVLTGSCELVDALREVPGTSLRVLPAGDASRASADLLTTRAAGELLLKLEQEAEVVLIDAPPILTAADGRFLAAQSRGVVVVAGSERATRDQLQEAAGVVRQLGAVLLGVVVAQAARRQRSQARRAGRRHGVAQRDRAVDPVAIPQLPGSEAVSVAGPARDS